MSPHINSLESAVHRHSNSDAEYLTNGGAPLQGLSAVLQAVLLLVLLHPDTRHTLLVKISYVSTALSTHRNAVETLSRNSQPSLAVRQTEWQRIDRLPAGKRTSVWKEYNDARDMLRQQLTGQYGRSLQTVLSTHIERFNETDALPTIPTCWKAMHAPVPSYHEVDDHSRDVDVGDRREAFVVHIFAQPRVTATHHENIVVLAHILQNPILQPGIPLTRTNIEGGGVHDLEQVYRAPALDRAASIDADC